MSNFTAAKVGGWSLRQKVTSAQLTQIQEMLLKAPNFSDGSMHNLTGVLTIGASGAGAVAISAPTTLSGPTGISGKLTVTGAENHSHVFFEDVSATTYLSIYSQDIWVNNTTYANVNFTANFFLDIDPGVKFTVWNHGIQTITVTPIPGGASFTVLGGCARAFAKVSNTVCRQAGWIS